MSMTPDELAGMVNEELKAELAALRAVAVAADALTYAMTLDGIAGNLGPAAPGYEGFFSLVVSLATARASGYLPTAEGETK